MTHCRAKAFARLRFVIHLFVDQIVQFVFDLVSTVIQVDSKGRLAYVRLLLHLYFEVARFDTLISQVGRLAFLTIIVLTFELVNLLLLRWLCVLQVVFDQLGEGLEVVECLQLVTLFDEVDWALFEKLIIKQSKEWLVVVEIQCDVRQLDSLCGFVHKLDLVAGIIQYDDSFIKIVKKLLVALTDHFQFTMVESGFRDYTVPYRQEQGVPDRLKHKIHDNLSVERITSEGDSTKEEENQNYKHSSGTGIKVEHGCDNVEKGVSHQLPNVGVQVIS